MILELFQRAFHVLFYPKKMLSKDSMSTHLLTIYVGVLALIPGVARFLSYSIVRVVEEGEEAGKLVITAKSIAYSLLYWIGIIIGFLVLSYVTWQITKLFMRKVQLNTIARIIAYSLTPILLSFVLSFIPYYAFFFMAYAFLILLTGIRTVLEPKVFWVYVIMVVLFLPAALVYIV